MIALLIILIVVASVLLGCIVMIQNPKGGGLTSNFSSSSQLMGVQKTGDFLEKGTWVLAIALMVLSLAINVAVKGGSSKAENPINETVEHASKPTAPTSTAPLTLPKSTDSAGAKK